ncbi:MAG: Sir2 family NAD-dependent protein deacetylase [Lentilactobacillus diolivorans]
MINKAKTRAELLDTVAELLSRSTNAVAFTGAGISTESGIPDFSEISRILNADRQFNAGVFGMLNSGFAETSPVTFYRLYRKTFFQPKAQPNFAHTFLANLESQGKLNGIATMNIDYLHQLAGSKNVFEYWGDMRKNHCIGCHRAYDWDIIKTHSVPYCPECGHLIVPDFVMRNLATYRREVSGGQNLLRHADLLFVIGTQRSSESFSYNIPKIVVNDEVSNGIENQTVSIHGKAAEIFRQLNDLLQN